ncbi:hypothetical protein RCC89_10080 [Cytophagaceae bacterium ABcell3]|nr:hypothetical protein RCC89_10080 [Cytophagaceae bacterium ABcell3]
MLYTFKLFNILALVSISFLGFSQPQLKYVEEYNELVNNCIGCRCSMYDIVKIFGEPRSVKQNVEKRAEKVMTYDGRWIRPTLKNVVLHYKDVSFYYTVSPIFEVSEAVADTVFGLKFIKLNKNSSLGTKHGVFLGCDYDTVVSKLRQHHVLFEERGKVLYLTGEGISFYFKRNKLNRIILSHTCSQSLFFDE